MIQSALLRYALAVALGLGALYGAYRHGVTTERDRSELAAETERSETARLILAEQSRSTARAEQLDTKHTGELNDAYARIKDLERPKPGAKPVRVFVKAECPARPGAMPEAEGAAGMGGRGQQGAQLNAAAQQDYFDLLRDIALKERALALCVAASATP